MCLDFLYNFCLKYFPFWEEFNEISSQKSKSRLVMYPLFLSDFKGTWILSKGFRQKPQISNFIKNRPVGAELFHTNRRTDRMTDGHDEANSLFLQFCKRT
jgi:hypothetical protein